MKIATRSRAGPRRGLALLATALLLTAAIATPALGEPEDLGARSSEVQSTTVVWTGHGSDSIRECSEEETPYLHWVLTPGGPYDLSNGVLTAGGTTANGYWNSATGDHGAMHFDTGYLDGAKDGELAASAAFEYQLKTPGPPSEPPPGPKFVLTISSGCYIPEDNGEEPDTYDVELVKVWNVIDDPDEVFEEAQASATLTATPATGLEDGDTFTVTETNVDPGHDRCTVTATRGTGTQTLDADQAVDGIYTHTVTNDVTCAPAPAVTPDPEEEPEVAPVVVEPEPDVAAEVVEKEIDEEPEVEVLAEVKERELPRTGADTGALALLAAGMLMLGAAALAATKPAPARRRRQ